jgi:glycosyltransferase involved in cell wall biosynthesis
MLSVAIIARDEETHIGAALASVAGLAGEVVVLLDDRTSDATATICREHGALVFVERWRNFSAQRNRALELCRGEWVLFLDADERVTHELRQQIAQVLSFGFWIADTADQSTIEHQQSNIVGYWIPRYNHFFGQVVRGGGWYPDHQLRLLRRGRARYDERRQVHEFAELDGREGCLTGHLLHLNIERLDELWRKQRAYALAEAQTLYAAGVRVRWRTFAVAPLREFVRRYVRLGGYRDGVIGLLLCGTLAYFELVKCVHQKALERHS